MLANAMSFNSYENLAQVLQDYQIQQSGANFIEVEGIAVRSAFREDLEFSLREFNFEESEYGVCEAIIFPILKRLLQKTPIASRPRFQGFRDSGKWVSRERSLQGLRGLAAKVDLKIEMACRHFQS